MTRDEAIAHFKLVGQLSGRKKRTMDNYLRALNDFCSYVEEVLKIHDFMDISLFDIQNYLHHLESRNYAVKTYNIYVYALRMFYSGVLDRMVDKYKLPVRHPKSKPKPIFTLEETLTLINQCPDPVLKAAIVLASGCGLRVSEIANLTFGDFNKAKQLIKIRDSKGDKTRYVPYMFVVKCR